MIIISFHILRKKNLWCDICEKQFNKISKYKQHIKNIHTEYHCKICKTSIVGKSEFDMHVKTHTVHCCKSSDKLELKSHLPESTDEHRISLTQNQSYPCDICNKTFSQNKQLKQHIKTHDASFTPAFICEYCGECFSASFYLKIHLQYHSEPAFYCEKCKESFFFKKQLRTHICKPVES